MAQLGKNLPAMRETWVRSLVWEDPLEEGKATHSSILAWRIPWGHKELNTTERLSLSQITGYFHMGTTNPDHTPLGKDEISSEDSECFPYQFPRGGVSSPAGSEV